MNWKVTFCFLLLALGSASTFGSATPMKAAALDSGSHTLLGKVIDHEGNPLEGAFIENLYRRETVISDEHGMFRFSRVQALSIHLILSYAGFKTQHVSIELPYTDTLVVQLVKSTLKLDEVVIKDFYSDRLKRESTLHVEVVNEEYLKKNLGGSLMKSLERLPGVSTIDIGSGQSKPVIRGLGFNRVVVVENNIKHESQQWGSDHGLEIDQYAVDHVEIIKGPASLMYGSDAIGGVVDMKNRRTPQVNTFGGRIDATGKTNNGFLGTSVSVFGRRQDVFFTARATCIDFADYQVPTNSVAIYSYAVPLDENRLRNTAGSERNFHTSFGMLKTRFQSRFFITNVHSIGGFFANAHGLEPRSVNYEEHDASPRDVLFPYHEVNHFKAINRSTLRGTNWKLEMDLGYQKNRREEWSQYTQHGYMPAAFPNDQSFLPELERQFDKEVYSASLKFSYEVTEKIQIMNGVSADHQRNDIGGRGFIIPAFDQLNLGAYAIAKHHVSKKSLLQAGVRYDYGRLNTESHSDWFASPEIGTQDTTDVFLQRAIELERTFSNVTWSVGYTYASDKWTFKSNAGKSFRMPIAKELAANGVNYHRFSYEVGDATLSPEVSYQLDLGVEYSMEKMAIGATPFINYFSNYIYLNPTSSFNRLYGFGNQVFEYTESEVFRAGGEVHAHYEISQSVQLGFIGEYIYAVQLSGEKRGYTLPFTPPLTTLFNVKFQRPALKAKVVNLKDVYAALDVRVTAAQNKIVPPELTTEGFQVFHIRLGGDVPIGRQTIEVSMQVQNVLNTRYFNHTSYYRLINVPEPGRNIVLHISMPFEGNLKDKKN